MIVRQRQERRNRRAFTLMEVLIVVAIVVAMAAVGGFFVIRYLTTGYESTARAQISVLTKAAKSYALENNGAYPQSLQELVEKGYLESYKALVSPWGENYPYQYDPSGSKNGGRKPDIFVMTPQGKVIGNWE